MNLKKTGPPLVILALILLIGVAYWVKVAGAGRDDPRVIESQRGWEGLKAARSDKDQWPPAFAWTGGKLLVYGTEPGSRARSTGGASFDPDSGDWRTFSNPPFSAALVNPQAVWTGTELIVLGPPCGGRANTQDAEAKVRACERRGFEAAAYDLRRERWRRLPVPKIFPLRGSESYFVISKGWTGKHAVFAARDGFLLFDPKADKWQTIDDPPFLPRESCIAGSKLVAIAYRQFSDPQAGAVEGPHVPTNPDLDLKASIFDAASGEWSPPSSPSTDASAPEVLGVVCTSKEVLPVASAEPEPMWAVIAARKGLDARAGNASKFNVSQESWSSLASIPSEFVPRRTRAAGDEVLVWAKRPGKSDGTQSDLLAVLVYDRGADEWQVTDETSTLPNGPAVFTGDRLVFYDATQSKGQLTGYSPKFKTQ